MQTSAIQNKREEATSGHAIDAIRAAHSEAQELANRSLKDSFNAIRKAKEAGELLAKAKTALGAESFAVWTEANFGEEMASKWAGRYIQCSQLQLNLDDLDPRQLKSGLVALELLPQAERQPLDHSNDSMKTEQRAIKRINDLCSIVGTLPKSRYSAYRVQFKELYEWMRRELYV